VILVHHHLGLGDHLICNGLVHHLADQNDIVYLPAKRRYLATVRCLYSEQPKVQVFPVDQEEPDIAAFARERSCPVLRVGFEHCNRQQFDASFYEQLGIPFDVRYTGFTLPRAIPHEDELFDRLAPREPYCLLHRESSGGVFDVRIDTTLPIVEIERRSDPYGNLLAVRKLIASAEEIHCINSSVLHLVDGMAPTARRFYHAVRQTDFTLRPEWTVVSYGASAVSRTWRTAVAKARSILQNG
jgi:hypothetical protein